MALSADILRGYTDTIILHQLSHGERAEHAARSSQHRDKKRLNADAAEARREATLYTAFRRLEAAGLIQSYWGSETSGARRRYYAITALGQEKLISDLAAWEDTKRQLDQLLEG